MAGEVPVSSTEADVEGAGPVKKRKVDYKKSSVACTPCRTGKLRCERFGDEGNCRRCDANGVECIWVPSQRGKWRRPTSDLMQANGTSMPPRASPSQYRPRPMHAASAEGGTTSLSSSQTDHLLDLGFASAGMSVADYFGSLSAPTQLPASMASSATSHPPLATPLEPSTHRSIGSGSATSRVEPSLVARASEKDKDKEHADKNGELHFKVDHTFSPLGLLAEASLRLKGSKNRPPHPDAPNGASISPESMDTAGQGRNLSEPDALQSPSSPEWEETVDLGPANGEYFSENIIQHVARIPAPGGFEKAVIVKRGIISIPQAHDLFRIFFDHFNPLLHCMDANMTTPALCCGKSPFLFTAICAVASRAFAGGVLYPALFQAAQTAGFEAMLQSKTPETVQGFLLLASWAPPASHYEHDTAWLFAGIAIRIANEIGMHRVQYLTIPEGLDEHTRKRYEQEIVSRTRTWVACYILDRTLSAESGKPLMITETFLIAHVRQHLQQPGIVLGDVWLSAQSQLVRMVSHFFSIIYSHFGTESSLSTTLNYLVLTRDFSHQVEVWSREFDDRLVKHHETFGGVALDIYRQGLDLDSSFYRLAIFSFGLQHTLTPGGDPLDQIANHPALISPCYMLAMKVVNLAEVLGTDVYRYATDSQYLKIVFASVFLLKLLSSEFGQIFDAAEILGKVEQVTLLLERSTSGPKHMCSLYAIFLRRQCDMHKTRSPPEQPVQSATAPAGLVNAAPAADARFSADVFSTRAESRERNNVFTLAPWNANAAPPTLSWLNTLNSLTNTSSLGGRTPDPLTDGESMRGRARERVQDSAFRVPSTDWLAMDGAASLFGMEALFPGSSF